MAQQLVGQSRLAQRTSSSRINANFTELYSSRTVVTTLAAAAAAGTFLVPAGYAITDVYIINNTANAITGGLKFGTALAGAQVIAAQAVGANALITVSDAALLLKLFSKTVDQTVYFDAVTAWNGANVDIVVTTRKVV